MKRRFWAGWLCALGFSLSSAFSAEWYVATNGNDSAAGTNWATAKLTIQAGVDAAADGDTVWVSNGVYSTGGRPEPGYMLTNVVLIDKPITVESVNGAETTLILGTGTQGTAPIRCAYVGTNAVLSGFSLTGGTTYEWFGVSEYLHESTGAGAYCETAAVLDSCVLISNTASYSGGGVFRGSLHDCLLAENQSYRGGGAFESSLTRCIVQQNQGGEEGGGAYGSELNQSLVVSNQAGEFGGGGTSGSVMNNCTVVGNHAAGSFMAGGGGVKNGQLNNCIVYGNTCSKDPNYDNSEFQFSCTTPDPGGTGNITNDPQFVDAAAGNYRLQTNSPCINGGDNSLVQGETDLDGNPRIAFGLPYGRVDMGAYEFLSKTRYVAKTGSDAAAGTNWPTAKLTIQVAVDEADNGDLVLVSNGVYATGGRPVGTSTLTNRVAIDKPIIVQSVNGPGQTIIKGAKDPTGTNGLGDAAVRCVYLADDAVLAGVALTNGATQAGVSTNESSGGGAKCEADALINRCVVAGNSAVTGGGISFGNVFNCLITGNEASMSGGGAYECMVNNCTVVSNSAPIGSDIFSCGGANSIANADPSEMKFVDAESGDYHLLPISPCIDAGDNAEVFGSLDLDGNPRMAYGTVDIGAYEAQLGGAGMWYLAITNGLTNDLDCVAGDGIPNLLKYATGSSPRISDDIPFLSWVLNNGIPTLVVNRNTNATDVVLTVSGADAILDDAVWRGVATNIGGSWTGATNVSESGSGNPVVVTVEDPVALESNRFLRLRVTRP